MHLFEALATRVSEWRINKYPSESYPLISEILEWCADPGIAGFRLRTPQIRALETYWYLRLIEGTPHILDLYSRMFDPGESAQDLLDALGIPLDAFSDCNFSFERLWEAIRNDNGLVKKYSLDTLRESLNLEYPDYIFALAMGAGKTVMIGSIIATEFAMAQEYPDNNFVENALVFAPGKTIIESLRELAAMSYEAILPPRLYKSFASTLKLMFTRDGDPEIPVVPGSAWNVIVTNTEKIRIQKETIRKADIGNLFSDVQEDEARAEIANLRLQAIASLPKLAIFSDEAHHTFGTSMDRELKKVRKTVDYLHNPFPVGAPEHDSHYSNLICVINTTGTPYFKRQPLRDVVIWYGLSEGIRDGILKEVGDNVLGFDFEGDVEEYLAFVIDDFFREYGAVTLPDGTPAKLAIFFPQTDDVEELRPVIDMALTRLGLPATLAFEHHTQKENKDAFDHFRNRDSIHRIALLVDRGVEGWNVPCLFAVVLARQLKSSNNFVLQASSRCLRQVVGNKKKARIYLSIENKNILDRQLGETYGESFAAIAGTQTQSRSEKIVIKKLEIPPLVVRKVNKRVVRDESARGPIQLTRPPVDALPVLGVTHYKLEQNVGSSGVLQQEGEREEIFTPIETTTLYSTAIDLAQAYHLDPMEMLEHLHTAYPDMDEIPKAHLPHLFGQVEAQTSNYKEVKEVVEVALALIKPEGFQLSIDEEGNEVYTAEISYPIHKEHLLARLKDWKEQAGPLGFHYDPYNFDSSPERSFFSNMLRALNKRMEDVEDIYFTGGITDPHKTDFYVEYKTEDGGWHRYSPDFVIRSKAGKCFIIEIKSENERDHPLNGEVGKKAIAARKWVDLNPDLLSYEMIFVVGDEVGYEAIAPTLRELDQQRES